MTFVAIKLQQALNEHWKRDTLTVSQPTQPLSPEQSINRLNRPE